MPRGPRSLAALAVLASVGCGLAACAGVDDSITELRSRASDTVDQVQFCLAVTRSLAAVDGGSSPSEARSAAEEVLTHVPEELRDDAQLVADRLRRAAETGDRSVLDEEFEAAAEDLRTATERMCDPRR